jgi:FMN phosphatase YigB (HAD superfamily)
MIKAICFDLDGVYFDGQSFLRFERDLPKEVKDMEQINQILYKSQIMQDFKRGLVSEKDYWEYAMKELNVTVDFDEVCKYLQDSYKVNEEIPQLVRQLHEKGYQTCICTNNYVTRI